MRRLVLGFVAVVAMAVMLGVGQRSERPPSPAVPVDLNVSDVAELTALPALGPQLAKRVVDERVRGGRFVSMADLMRRVPGIGPAKALALAPYLASDSPSSARGVMP